MPDLPPPTPLKLTDEIKATVNSALESGSPILVAAVTAEGRPVLSFRGSLQVYSDTQLGFWLRAWKATPSPPSAPTRMWR